MSTSPALRDAAAGLAAAGCDTPRLDAELLLAEAIGCPRERLFSDPDVPLPPDAARHFDELVSRRARREPVAYILGRRWFRDIELAVDGRVLVPRPETELLVEVALDLPRGARVHDVGTGSGAVALAIKHERPDLEVSGSDSSPEAVEVARENAGRLGIDVAFAVLSGAPDRPVDLLTANLPYVRDDEFAGLAPELHFEPRAALAGGPDGLGLIRELVVSASSGRRLALEHAPAQAESVRSMLRDAVTLRDLAGRERVTVGVK